MASSLFGPSQTNSFSNLQQLKSVYNLLKSAKDPSSMMQNMINTNPQMRNVMEYIKSHGGDPERAFYAMAAEKGVDPNQILDLLK